jgi:DNA mismatch repair ATPase MutS
MRLTDSLERGVSYFYAEVQRIRLLLETARAHPGQTLFLLDELFMGTNTRERQLASQKLLVLLLDLGAIGAVTTHDLALCELAAQRPERVRNVHFRDQVHDGQMTFDYRLREGVVETTNALEVLRRAGVPV